MPILDIEQPEYVIVSDDIRLRKFDNNFAFALGWYQDEETLMLVDGDKYVPIGDEEVDEVAKRVLSKHMKAFEELAK